HRLGISIKHIVFDVMLASYIIDPSRTIDDVNSVVANYGQHYVQSSVTIYGKGKKKQIPTDDVLNPYVGSIINAISQVKPKIQQKLNEYNQTDILYDLELTLAQILSEMEETGIYTEIGELQQMETEIQSKLDVLIDNIYDAAGEKFNINSPKQLGVVLFETLKLTVIKKTKTGYSTAVDRKSTRLNSSHVSISYAVFCLKKKKTVYVIWHT